MANLQEIREQWPQYNDLDDESFVNAFHQKFYSDMPIKELKSKIGYQSQADKKMSLKDVFSQAYGSKAMGERQRFENQARQQIPKTAANLGLGALQEVANWAPNIANSFGVPLPRADEGFTQYAPQIEQQETIQNFGRALPHLYGVTKGFQATNKIKGLNPQNKMLSYLADVGKIGGLEYLLSDPEHKAESAIGGAAATAAISPLAKLFGRFMGPNRKNVLNENVQSAKAHENLVKEQMAAQEKALEQSKMAGARQFGKESMERQGKIENIQESLTKKIPSSESQNIGELGESLQEAHGDIVKNYQKMYSDFASSAAGKKPIKKGIDLREVEALEIGENSPPELKKDIDNFIGKKTKQEAHTDIIMGNVPEKTVYEAKTGTVQDYLTMSKKARDEALRYGRMAKDRNATFSEKERYREISKKYRKFQKMLDERITNSLDLPEAMQYQGIQGFFKNYEVPFRESSILKTGSAPRPKIKSKDFFSSLTRENEPKLATHLLEKYPRVKNAIAKHDLMDIDFSNPKAVEKIIKSDRFESLPENIQKDLTALDTELKQKEMVDTLIPEIGRSELSFVKKYPKMNDIFRQRPDLRVPFGTVEAENVRLGKIKTELEKAGVNTKEAEQILKEYKESIRGLGSLLSIVLGNKVYYGSRAISSLAGINKEVK